MRVRYRLIEKRWHKDEPWELWGAVYDNAGEMFTDSAILVTGSLAEHRSVLRYFEERIGRLALTLENAERMLGEYASAFQVRPQIETIEGRTFQDIHRRLWRQIFDRPRPRDREIPLRYTIQPAYHALREEKDEYHAG
ncbi:MAG TPA: hypothetical protein ENJ31_05385 [Anaerolineae bacterium]|nr:hypothetical protein [Anaerolineae bacterium]